MADRDDDPEVMANRDLAIPVVSIIGPPDRSTSPSSGTKKRWNHGISLSAAKMKDKLEGASTPQSTESSSSLQDRLMSTLLQQIIPVDSGGDEDKQSKDQPKDRRSQQYVERPAFSLPTMSQNFRRFNARIGVAFVFQNRLIRLFTWKKPTQTLSFLAVYSFLCIDPALIAVLPLSMCLFFIMVPAFLARHPPPPANRPTDLYPLHGPPIAPARNIRPAADLSKDFFRNMRDLQNSMEDFTRAHDAAVTLLAPPTNFSNEALSSAIFLILMFSSCSLFLFAHLIPWRAVFLVVGWLVTGAGHPSCQALMQTTETDQLLEAREDEARTWLLRFSNTDIMLSNAPEHREVEVFELQRRSMHTDDTEFEPFIFSPSPYSPLSQARITGDRPLGTRFFEDVAPPRGWRWSDKKWTLDLLSREWVEDRYVTGVEVEIEGERWVTDIQYDDHAYDEEEDAASAAAKKAKPKSKSAGKTWEEGYSGMGKKGEWRRRRWVRLVERRVIRAEPEGL